MHISQLTVLSLFVMCVYCDDCVTIEDVKVENENFNLTQYNQTFIYKAFVPNDYELLSVAPAVALRPFLRYNHVATYSFNVPNDVSSAIVTFRAATIKVGGAGAGCERVNVTVHFKHAGYPVVSPQDFPFPNSFYSEEPRHQTYSIEFLSDTSNNAIYMKSPNPGNYYVISFISWTDPRSQSIQPPGINSVCQTILYSDVVIKREEVETINCDSNMVINGALAKQYYKCLSGSRVSYNNISLTVVGCENCPRKLLMVQKRILPSFENNIVKCLMTSNSNNEVLNTLEILFQPSLWYYITVEDTLAYEGVELCSSFENEIDYNDLSLVENSLIKEISVNLFRYTYRTKDDNSINLNMDLNKTYLYDFYLESENDIGGTLTIGCDIIPEIEKNNSIVDCSTSLCNDFVSVVICVQHEHVLLPTVEGNCVAQNISHSATMILNNTYTPSSKYEVHIPYPEHGQWFLSVRAFYGDSSTSSVVNISLSISSHPCIKGSCGNYGQCNSFVSGGFLFSSCYCHMNYGGWDCSDDSRAMSRSEVLLSSLLLTLSNLFFVPSIYFAIRRKFYTEAGVYGLTMIFSTFYHACDAGETVYDYCIIPYDVLQYGDFYCGFLAFWVTLVAMSSVNRTIKSFLHVIGGVLIAIANVWNRFSLVTFITPIAVGVVVVIVNWIIKIRKYKRLYPSKFYWMYCVTAGIICIAVALVCYAFLQTNENYKFVHSVWHILVAISIICLLPDPNYFYPKYLSKL